MKVKEESEKVGLKLYIQKTKIMASGPITSWQIDGETVEIVRDLILGGSKITADGECSHEIKRCLLLGRKTMTKLDSILKSRHITLWRKIHLVKAMVFPVATYGCESWTKRTLSTKELMLLTVVLEKTFGSPLDSMEIQPVNPKGNLSWIFIGRTDAEAEAPIIWPPDVKSWLIGKDWRQEEKGMTEDEMAEWYHWLDGHEFEQALGGGDGQGILACCSPWSHNESDTTEWLNWTELKSWWETCLILSPWVLYIEKKFKPLLYWT